VTLHDDLVADAGVQGAGRVGQHQRAGIAAAQSGDGQLGEPGENVIAGAGPCGAHDRDPLGEQAAGDEPQDLHRGLIAMAVLTGPLLPAPRIGGTPLKVIGLFPGGPGSPGLG
jgi:hypothetical protein